MISAFACGLVLWGVVVGVYEGLAPNKRPAAGQGEAERVGEAAAEEEERQGLLT